MRRFACLLALMMGIGCLTAGAEDVPPAEIFQAPRQIVISFTGDCTLGCTPTERESPTGFESYIEKNGFEYPFEKVRDIFLQDDLTVVNLEGVFYDYENNRVKKTYNFRAPTAYAQILPLSGIEAVSLSNNHIMDYGEYGLRATVQAREAQGTAWFGGNDAAFQTYIFEKDGVKVGFAAAYISDWWQNKDLYKNGFEQLKAAGCSVIIGCMHGGVEYDVFHDNQQEILAKAFIRYGADIVIGHHPHTLQGITVEDGRTVLWSMGNFAFGGNSKLRNNAMGELSVNTYIAQFTLSFDESGTYLGHQLNIIPCHVSGTKEFNDYQPCPVQGKEAASVLANLQRDTSPRSLKLKPYVEGVGAVQEFVPAPVR